MGLFDTTEELPYYDAPYIAGPRQPRGLLSQLYGGVMGNGMERSPDYTWLYGHYKPVPYYPIGEEPRSLLDWGNVMSGPATLGITANKLMQFRAGERLSDYLQRYK